jgi:poly(3-hydroxybutyrate) depolymerase
VNFAGQAVTIWSGNPSKGPGPLLIYWYATDSSATEPTLTIGTAQIAKITAMGGVVAAQNATTAQGNTTGNNVWYTGDAAIADEIVACSIKNQGIDPRRIHSAGYSAGALQTVYMWYARSGYIASVLSYSGGVDGINQPKMQDPTNVPPAIAAHGGSGQDTFGGVIDFYTASHNWETAARKVNGFMIDCDDGGTHTAITTRDKIAPEAVQFFLDHPFKVSPEPYTSLASPPWPSYCTIVP